jgi:UDP-N-acetyl-D-galactosamine dehydrogenase
MLKRRIHVEGARALVMGLAFKENCPDLRNTRVIDIVRVLAEYNVAVDVFDPWVSVEEAQREYGLTPVAAPQSGRYDAIVLAVAHDQFRAMGASRIRALGRDEHVLYDLKHVVRAEETDIRL